MVTVDSVRRVDAVVIKKQLHSTPILATDPYASLVVSVVHHLTEDEVQGEWVRKRILRWREEFLAYVQRPRYVVVRKERRIQWAVQLCVDVLQVVVAKLLLFTRSSFWSG